MKRTTAAIMTLVGILLAGSPQVQASQQEKAKHTIVPGVGVGDFTFGMTKDEVIKKLGKPQRIFWSWGEEYTLNNLPARYIMDFDGLSFGINNKRRDNGRIARIVAFFRQGEQHRVYGISVHSPSYIVSDGLKVGDTEERVIRTLGKGFHLEEYTYRDFITYQDRGLTFEVHKKNRTVTEITIRQRSPSGSIQTVEPFVDETYRTLLSPEGSLAIVRQPPGLGYYVTKLPSYDPAFPDVHQADVRGGDLSDMDLRDRFTDLMHAIFDDRTIWPADLPDGFDPKQMMTLGRNPGLRVRELHQRGITGKGIGIGIIDTPLYVDHVEYRDRLRLYEEIHCHHETATTHGTKMTTVAVGKTTGVAPEADLYFIGVWHYTGSRGALGERLIEFDGQWIAKSIDRLLEINRTLPPDRKIRVISRSGQCVGPVKGSEEIVRAIERATKEGVFVINCSLEDTHNLAFHGLGRDPLKDPDDVQSYGPGLWWREEFFRGGGRSGHDRMQNAEPPWLMVPMGSRCTASPCGPENYGFYESGGWSGCVQYLAGLYALACQVKPTVTPEEFWSVGLETGKTITIDKDGKTYQFGKIVDPVALVRTLEGKSGMND